MKKLSTFTKIALSIMIAGIIYGIVKQSWDMIIMCGLFFILSILELQGKIKYNQRTKFQYPRFLLDKSLTTY